MQRLAARLLAGLALVVGLPLLASAQTSAISGEVKDSSGGVLPGVTVEVASPALIEKVRSSITDGAGRYTIPALRPGTYSVTFSLPGFNTVKREGITLNSDFTARNLTINTINSGQTSFNGAVGGSAPLASLTTNADGTTRIFGGVITEHLLRDARGFALWVIE